MSRSKDIGTETETAVVRYLRTHGWPSAERRALAGGTDLGDITGTPGLCWEIKGGATAEAAGDQLITDWLDETETERANAGADLGILVTKRASYGAARTAWWWAHMDLTTLSAILRARRSIPADLATAPARMHLHTAVALLHAAGYGDGEAA